MTTPSGSGSSPSSTGHTSEKRTDGVLKWDEYFMGVAFLSAQRSKDPNTQVGACIVNAQNRIVGTGYNGMPNGLDDDKMPWGSKSKYYYVCHAELNAIVNKFQADVRDCRMYVSLYPCNECAKLIVQSGIKEVIYFSDKYHDTPESEAARDLLKKAGVTVREAFSQNQNQCRGGCQHTYDHSTQTGFLSCSNSPGTDAEQPK